MVFCATEHAGLFARPAGDAAESVFDQSQRMASDQRRLSLRKSTWHQYYLESIERRPVHGVLADGGSEQQQQHNRVCVSGIRLIEGNQNESSHFTRRKR